MEEISFDENEDWENRILCSDEACIGTVGPDGKCRECGKAYEGTLSERQDDEKIHLEFSEKQESADSPSDDDWDNRVLCSDESCIGVIGPDGKCKECGKPL